MKRLLPLLFLYLLATLGMTAQEKNRGPIFHTGSEGPVYDYTVEAGFPRLYYDDGGPSRGMRGNYSKTIIKLKPLNSNSHITIVFEQMEIGEYDELRFYNGAIELWNGPNEDGEYYYDWPKGVDPIKTVKGTPSNPHFTVTSTAADGCLSVALFNGSNSPGWKAMVYCVRNGDPEPTPNETAILAPATAEATSIYYDADQRAIVSETPLAQITLYSLQGEMIMHATSGGTHYALPELPVGSYLVHVESADGAILTLKVVVAK